MKIAEWVLEWSTLRMGGQHNKTVVILGLRPYFVALSSVFFWYPTREAFETVSISLKTNPDWVSFLIIHTLNPRN